MRKQTIHILAIESSCDDTSAAVLSDKRVLSNIISTQDVHEKYGGVVPELASRSHQKNIVPVANAAIEQAGLSKNNLDAVAYTVGPGLPGSLIVGSAFAKSISMALDVPLIEVNHMEAHILAHFIEDAHPTAPVFPFLCLTVSGGHSQIVLVKDYNKFEVVGQTLDDAAGEAFDKIAKLIGLSYPGGPLIDKHAAKGNAERFSFSKPKVDSFNYSFSGLKTGVLYFLRDSLKENPAFIKENFDDICASVQKTIIEILINKLEKAARHFGILQIAVAGGVSANSSLRAALKERETSLHWKTFVPPIEYCTDNAAMIGITAYFKYIHKEFSDLNSVPKARLYL